MIDTTDNIPDTIVFPHTTLPYLYVEACEKMTAERDRLIAAAAVEHLSLEQYIAKLERNDKRWSIDNSLVTIRYVEVGSDPVKKPHGTRTSLPY